MSKRFSNTTADYLEWREMTTLVRQLADDGRYTISLLVACGSFWGLRISDLRALVWRDILNTNTLQITEHKTGKRRIIVINPQLRKLIKDCYLSLKEPAVTEFVFKSQTGSVYSIQRLNVIFKSLKSKYNLHIGNFSSHSLRKTFGRQVFEQAGENSEMALIKLSEIFGHSTTAITKRYLGIKQQEIADAYNSLSF